MRTVTVEFDGGCWLYVGSVDRDGYPYAKWNRRTTRAHRVVYSLHNADKPDVVMHTCDVRRCINPSHLKGGTHGDNVRDMIAKGRRGHPTPGGRSPEHAFRGRRLGAKDKKPRTRRLICKLKPG